MVPIHSAFCPPSIPNRSQLLKMDPLRRASYPDEVREVEDGFIGNQAIDFSLIMIYVCGLFVYSLYGLG